MCEFTLKNIQKEHIEPIFCMNLILDSSDSWKYAKMGPLANLICLTQNTDFRKIWNHSQKSPAHT